MEQIQKKTPLNIRPLVIWPDEALRKVSRPVETFDDELKLFSDELTVTMIANRGYGLAAPQVGDHRRLIVVTVNQTPVVMVNPVIRETFEQAKKWEGCLSVPGFKALIVRSERVIVDYQDVRGLMHTLDTGELDSQSNYLTPNCVQHEIDHLDGKLFTDGLSELKLSMAKKAVRKWRSKL